MGEEKREVDAIDPNEKVKQYLEETALIRKRRRDISSLGNLWERQGKEKGIERATKV